MPTRRIPDEELTYARPQPCYSSDHRPPSHQVFEPGVYEHECSECGQKTIFTVNNALCRDDGTNPMHAFGYGRGDD